ncbi:MAG: EamA family transporter [Euryarchaeota archaeon]|nr:EamA family transporter [Euryarchaeota archaeon]
MRVPPAVAFAACSLIWGTTWLAIKIGYGGLDPVWGASLRFLFASLLMAPLILAKGAAPPLGRRQFGVVLFVGFAMFGLDYGLIYWAEQSLNSGLTAILFATMPLFVTLFGTLLIPTERLTAGHLSGVALGLGGLLLIFAGDLRGAVVDVVPMAAIILAAAAAGSTSVVVRRWGHDLSPLSLNATAMMVGGLALAAASLSIGETPSLPRTDRAWMSLGFLVLFGSVVSFILYWDLLKVWTHHRAGLVPIVTPVVAVTTGLFVGERLTALQWVGSAIVLGGVALSLLPARLRAAQPAGPVTAGK